MRAVQLDTSIARFTAVLTRSLAVLSVVLLFGFGAAVEALDFDIVLTSPETGVAAFGEVDFAAEVLPTEAIAEIVRVELMVDGEVVAELTEPPFSAKVDLGEENQEHRFEARATAVDGEIATALIVTPSIPIDDEVSAELQQLYVTVSRNGRRVLSLEERDFAILDNGKRQDLITFARGDVRLTAALLIDSSVSMRGDRLRHALIGATTFVRRLLPSDDAGLFLFSDRLLYSTPFSNDTTAIAGALSDVDAHGGTALNDHLYLGLKLLEGQQGRRVIIVLTDGFDTHSALRMEEVTWLARRSRALIYWLRSGDPRDAGKTRFSAWKDSEDYRNEYDQFSKAVVESGGRIVELRRIEEASKAFGEILAELREQYVLGYYPSDNQNDGEWHRVLVRVRDELLEVRTRGGYVDY